MSYIEDIPKYGFGTAFDIGIGETKMGEKAFTDLLQHAIKLGCRHFDCSPLYGTQALVGTVLKQAMISIPRKELFVTSKLPVHMMRPENVYKSIRKTLIDLQLTYLDLFLIHAPFATKYVNDNEPYPLDNQGNLMLDESEHLLEKTWSKMVDLKAKGYVKYIGLSNVNKNQLDRLNLIHQVDVVQNEYHLFNRDRQLFDHCEESDVHYEAYAAFGCPPKAKSMNLPVFDADPLVNRIARENNLTPAQVIIQWLHQQPLSYVIRTDNIAQLEENLEATKHMTLTVNDMIDLDMLNKNARLYYFDHHKDILRHPEYPIRR